jgi:hypothetical protein
MSVHTLTLSCSCLPSRECHSNSRINVFKIIFATCLCSDPRGVSDFSNGHLMTRVYNGSSVMSPNRPSLLWPSVATVLGGIISSPGCYCDYLVAATSHCECYTSPLLLSAIAVMAIRVISLGTVASKGSHVAATS